MSLEDELEAHHRVFGARERDPRPVLDHGPAHRRYARRMARRASARVARAPAVHTYDPSQVHVTFNGVALQGFMDGAPFEIEAEPDVVDAVAAGVPIRATNSAGSITMTLIKEPLRIPAWPVLARLVDHARLHGGHAGAWSNGWLRAQRDEYEVTLNYFVAEPPNPSTSIGPDDEFEYTERMSVLWAERAIELQRAGANAPVPKAWKSPCRACGVGHDVACRPLHQGEREPGTWVHPVREQPLDKDADPGNPRAIVVAQQYLSEGGDIGLRHDLRRDMLLLAREVIASDKQRRSGAIRYVDELNKYPREHGNDMVDALAYAMRSTNLMQAIGQDLDRLAADRLGLSRFDGETDEAFRDRVRG